MEKPHNEPDEQHLHSNDECHPTQTLQLLLQAIGLAQLIDLLADDLAIGLCQFHTFHAHPQSIEIRHTQEHILTHHHIRRHLAIEHIEGIHKHRQTLAHLINPALRRTHTCLWQHATLAGINHQQRVTIHHQRSTRRHIPQRIHPCLACHLTQRILLDTLTRPFQLLLHHDALQLQFLNLVVQR